MAAVSLKDLMNPLTKIEEHAKATSEKLDRIEQLLIRGVGGSASGGGVDISALVTGQDIMIELQSAMLTQLGAQTKYLQILAKGGRSLSNIFGGKGSGGGNAKEGGKILEQLGIGIKELGKGMLVWALVPKKTITKLSFFITEVFSALASQDNKKTKEGVQILDMMGGAIFKFSGALAASAVLLIPGMIAIPFLISSIAIMGLTMSMLGSKKISKNINRGSRVLDRMGDAILAFGIGMAAFALTTLFIVTQPGILVGMVASLLLIGGSVALLGSKKMSKQIRRGALSLALLGGGLAIFSLGYVLFAKSTQGVGLMDVLVQSAVILGIGVASALVGKFGLSNVAQGALALVLNGLGLMVFSLGYVPFAEATKGIGLKDVLVQSGVLVAIGGVMALAGLAVAATAGAALLGPALFAAAGGSLLLLAPGLQAMKDLDYSETDAKDLATTLGAVAMAFSGVDPEAGAFGMVKGLFTRVIQSGGGLAAAGMYAAAGASLTTLSKGLADFKDIDFTEEDSKQLAIALGSVSGAFAQAGGEPASPGGLFGAIFGNTFSPNATERGIDSVMDAGNALVEITKGLASFLDLKKKYKLDGDAFKEGGYLHTSITETLGFLNSAFAAIGNNETSDSWGPFSWDENNVEKGIDAVSGAGEALTDVVTGLKSFLDLKDNYGLTSDSFAEGGYLYNAVTDTLSFVSKAFATIGGMETEDSWGPFRWDENSVAKGIDAVSGAGEELTNIATGLKTFQELVEKDIDFSEGGKLANAVTNSLTFVGDAFAKIGGKEESDGWFIFSWDENLVEKGIDAVKGAGAQLKDIAMGLKTFQELVEKEVDFSPKGKLANAVKNSLTFVGDAFAAIGGKEETDSTFFGLITWDENLVQKGIENVDGAGKALLDIAESLSKFAELENPTDLVTSISGLMQGISDVFVNTYQTDPEFSSHIDDFRRLINDIGDRAADGDLEKAAADMKSMAEAINMVDLNKAEAFGALFKGAADITDNGGRAALNALTDAVEEIKDILSSGGGGGNTTPAPAGGGEGGNTTPAPSSGKLESTLARISSTLSSLNSTMNNLPGTIAAIEIKVPQS